MNTKDMIKPASNPSSPVSTLPATVASDSYPADFTVAEFKARLKAIVGFRAPNPIVTRTPEDRGYSPEEGQP